MDSRDRGSRDGGSRDGDSRDGPVRAVRWPEIAAAALSAVWVAGLLGYLWRLPDGAAGPGILVTLLILLLPLAPVWATVVTLRAVRMLREEARFLRATVEAMRRPPAAVQRPSPREEPQPQSQAQSQSPSQAQGTFVTRREAARPAAPAPRVDGEQPALALGAGPHDNQPPPVAPADFIRALNFPEDAADAEGFRAMRAALADRTAAKVIRAAQDVLTLLSQQGIFTDDLAADRAQPDLWRRFAQGARGREVASLGGVRDREALALVAHRMREDPVFRDAGHHFLRSFDRAFSAFEAQASDADLVALAQTRTARAFMLVGRVAGTFD